MFPKTLAPIEDDTEEAPWMTMGTPQFEAVTAFYTALDAELRRRHSPLFVAGMLPIRYFPIPGGRIEQLSPDLLVAAVPDHPRNSYNLAVEGVAPAFVLEIISPESRVRDLQVKPERYELMGVREYALFAPDTPDGTRLLHPPLQGFRRDPSTGGFIRWEADEQGRLYSDVLELWLVLWDGELRAQRPDGSLAPTLEEESYAREIAEAELARLRAELARRGER